VASVTGEARGSMSTSVEDLQIGLVEYVKVPPPKQGRINMESLSEFITRYKTTKITVEGIQVCVEISQYMLDHSIQRKQLTNTARTFYTKTALKVSWW
jgi:hypothetical protein